MDRVLVTLIVCLAVCATVLAVPTTTGDERRDRGPKDLSNEPHYTPDAEHNPDYDHDAFLGKEQADRFDQLSPKEAKRRLGIIVGKIDKDKDGFVTNEELVEWIRHVAHRYVYDDADRQWGYHDKNDDGLISWEEYKDGAFGIIEDHEDIYDHHRQLTYKEMMERDERRFKAADEDGDGNLSKEEFPNFLHPEEAPHMREIVVDETMADMDKDKDGYVVLEEYINDLWPAYERAKGEEPDWVKSEREQFGNFRDQDKNGKLDRKEIGDWILPEDFDHAEAEARHLIAEADTNKDKQLTKEEILDHQSVFVGSQATDFGDYLTRHDEF